MTVRAHLIGNPALLQAISREPRIGAQDGALDMIRLRGAGIPGRQNDQAVRTLCDRNPDRRVGRDRAVGQIKVLVADGSERAGDCGRGDDRLGGDPSDSTTLSPETISVVTM